MTTQISKMNAHGHAVTTAKNAPVAQSFFKSWLTQDISKRPKQNA